MFDGFCWPFFTSDPFCNSFSKIYTYYKNGLRRYQFPHVGIKQLCKFISLFGISGMCSILIAVFLCFQLINWFTQHILKLFSCHEWFNNLNGIYHNKLMTKKNFSAITCILFLAGNDTC